MPSLQHACAEQGYHQHAQMLPSRPAERRHNRSGPAAPAPSHHTHLASPRRSSPAPPASPSGPAPACRCGTGSAAGTRLPQSRRGRRTRLRAHGGAAAVGRGPVVRLGLGLQAACVRGARAATASHPGSRSPPRPAGSGWLTGKEEAVAAVRDDLHRILHRLTHALLHADAVVQRADAVRRLPVVLIHAGRLYAAAAATAAASAAGQRRRGAAAPRPPGPAPSWCRGASPLSAGAVERAESRVRGGQGPFLPLAARGPDSCCRPCERVQHHASGLRQRDRPHKLPGGRCPSPCIADRAAAAQQELSGRLLPLPDRPKLTPSAQAPRTPAQPRRRRSSAASAPVLPGPPPHRAATMGGGEDACRAAAAPLPQPPVAAAADVAAAACTSAVCLPAAGGVAPLCSRGWVLTGLTCSQSFGVVPPPGCCALASRLSISRRRSHPHPRRQRPEGCDGAAAQAGEGQEAGGWVGLTWVQQEQPACTLLVRLLPAPARPAAAAGCSTQRLLPALFPLPGRRQEPAGRQQQGADHRCASACLSILPPPLPAALPAMHASSPPAAFMPLSCMRALRPGARLLTVHPGHPASCPHRSLQRLPPVVHVQQHGGEAAGAQRQQAPQAELRGLLPQLRQVSHHRPPTAGLNEYEERPIYDECTPPQLTAHACKVAPPRQQHPVVRMQQHSQSI